MKYYRHIQMSSVIEQGPVVQSIVSLKSSLRGQLVKCFTTLLPNTHIFFVEKMREAFAKASHIFSTKNNGVFQILTFEILTKHYLTMSLVLNNRALMSSFADNLLLRDRISVNWCHI